METKIRIIIADDERPARSFLAAMLRTFPNTDLIGEATNGAEAVEMIERLQPDLALLDLQMPELDGLGVARLLRKDKMPLIAFVTAYDEYAVKAFDLNAVDYLLKPVERNRLLNTLNRVEERLEHTELRERDIESIQKAASQYEQDLGQVFLERIPVRRKDEIIIVPVNQIASIIAEGELLHIYTLENKRFTLSFRLKDLESRLDPSIFIRLSRGTLANVNQIDKLNPLPGGTYLVTLHNSQQLHVSRLQARILKDQLLKL